MRARATSAPPRVYDNLGSDPAEAGQAPSDHAWRRSRLGVLLRWQDDDGLHASRELVAVAEAPPTIDGALNAAYDSAAIYFPFTDVIVADPYKDIADGLEHAFVIGQSRVVGGTTTDMVAIVSDRVFGQIWIGADDKLPRMIRAVYADDPSRLRHQVEFSNWRLDGEISADTFALSRAASAPRIPFARPDQCSAGRRGRTRKQTVRDQIGEENAMKTIVIGLASLLIVGFLCAPAAAWYHAVGWGGPLAGQSQLVECRGLPWHGTGRRGLPGAPRLSWRQRIWRRRLLERHRLSRRHGVRRRWIMARHGADGGTASGGDGHWHGTRPMGRRPTAGTIAITGEPMRRIIRPRR